MSTLTPVRRALISVTDKTGVEAFARRLAAAGVEIVSTGGTAALLKQAGLVVRDVSDLTGFPEMMDGRVKTLHPGVHGGLLARRDDAAHLDAMRAHGIAAIDLLVVNLYPFEKTASLGAPFDTCMENIDIGGPAMIRAAAKNHAFVAVIVETEDYEPVAAEIESTGAVSVATKRRLAARAYARTAAYDAAISSWFASVDGEMFPKRFALAGERAALLRYGENPHQEAAFYTSGALRHGVSTARQLQGKELSYNNLNDTDAAYELVAELGADRAAVAIIKHANPCGVARADTLAEAYALALRCDPVSAFGGVVALNRALDAKTAAQITEIFSEVIIAPSIDADAATLLKAKKNLRVLDAGGMPDPAAQGLVMKPLAGGFLLQSRDNGRIGASDLKTVTKRAPTAAELRDLIFAFRIAKHVKSNAIVYARDEATVGIGAGQMSRVDSSRIAAQKSADAARAAGIERPLAEGSVVASDAFFPFADGLLEAARAGATAVIQPGGSIRDEEVIAAADAAGLAMVFTGMRHFRH
jgi:phosphoribosylaminoimidazolecarboxamide formyltransferase/IMP cyclohydrolase